MHTFKFLPLLVIGFIPALLFGQVSFFSDMPPEETADALLAEMESEEVLGQIMMIGYTGTSPSEEVLRWIEEEHIGGIKIFGWNVGTLPELASGIGEMQRKALSSRFRIPLLIATDQEGGWVRHVKEETSTAVGNMALGATALPYDAYQTGYYLGLELKALGINMNFAPTVDLYANPEAHVIGPRAFSDDPVLTAELALAYFKGFQKAGIIATAKHYPGHGDARVDSHVDIARINKSFTELWEKDLIPFRHLVHEGIPAVMGGHLSFPSIIDENVPATLSRFFQTDLLRDELGFQGICITDDLLMTGVTGTGLSIDEIAVRAVSAGNDIILISRNSEVHRRVWDRLLNEMKTDGEFAARVYESARRVLITKAAYLRGETSPPVSPDAATIFTRIPNREGQDFFFDLACRSVSVVKNDNIPFDTGDPEQVLLAGQFQRFIRAGTERYPGAGSYYFPYDPFYAAEKRHIDALKKILPDYSAVIFCLANPNSAEVLQALRDTIERHGITCIAFSVLSPAYLYEFPWIHSSLAVYGFGEESFQAGFAVLSGDYSPEGTFPIDFDLFYSN